MCSCLPENCDIAAPSRFFLYDNILLGISVGLHFTFYTFIQMFYLLQVRLHPQLVASGGAKEGPGGPCPPFDACPPFDPPFEFHRLKAKCSLLIDN